MFFYYSPRLLKCYLLIFYFIQQLVFLPITVVDAFLDLETKEFLNGKTLRAAILHYPPSVIIKKEENGIFSYDGTNVEVLKYFASAFNINFEYVHIEISDVKKDGMAPAQINSILNNQADIFAVGIVASPSSYSQVDLTVNVLMEPYRLFVPWPEEESRLLATIRPFDPIVWVCLGVSLAVLTPTLSLLSGLYEKFINTKDRQQSTIDFNSVGKSGLFLLSHLTNHGYHLRWNSRATSVVIGMWCLTTVVLANAYAGTLFSFLSVAKLQPIINSLDELANSTQVQLVTQARTQWVNYLMMNATSRKEKSIGDSLRSDPSNLASTIEEAEAKLMAGKHAYAYYEMFAIPLIDSMYKKSGNKCRLVLAKEPISFFVPATFGLAKNGPYTTAFNKNFQSQIEAGLFDRYIKNRMPRIDQCLIKNQKASARQKPLTLTDMSSAFVILGLGMSLSVLIFLLELVYKRIMDQYFC